MAKNRKIFVREVILENKIFINQRINKFTLQKDNFFILQIPVVENVNKIVSNL